MPQVVAALSYSAFNHLMRLSLNYGAPRNAADLRLRERLMGLAFGTVRALALFIGAPLAFIAASFFPILPPATQAKSSETVMGKESAATLKPTVS